MKDYPSINKKWWDSATSIHAKSKLYDLPAFKKGKSSLQKIETEELGNVRNKKILHLLCHFGQDSLSLARKGAIVTGSDISDSSMKLARKLSREIGAPAKFIASDVYALPKVLDDKFDIVFVSYGVLIWLSNMKKFAKIVSNFLKPGGFFYIVELHPFTNILSYDFKMDFKYFDKGPIVDDEPGTYADWNAPVKGDTYLWTWTFGDIINSLIAAGLKIEFVHEFPFTMYDQFPGLMEKNKKGQYVLKDKEIQIPLLFSLKATK